MPEYFNSVSLVVIDEGHILGNIDNRSALFEFLILRLKRRLKASQARFLFISAVMPELNAENFSLWLSNKPKNVIHSPKGNDGIPWQPTRRLIGKFSWRGENGRIDYPYINLSQTATQPAFVPSIIKINKYTDYTPKLLKKKEVLFPYVDKSTKLPKKSDTAIELAYKFAQEGPVLIFCSHPGHVIDVGNAFLNLMRLKNIDDNKSDKIPFKYQSTMESLEIAEKWMGDCPLTQCLHWQVGLHYGTLSEPIRKSIEDDYKNKKLKVLIATNTLAQGINFPVKTIIIHSVVRNAQTNDKISVRDFWNIVGRAGRAGQETEGQIIFISNNDKDESLFNYYSNPKNIENVESIIYVILQWLLEHRISQENFSELISSLLDPQILALLVEESIDTPDEAIIRDILQDSLVKIQSVDLRDDILVNELLGISQKICFQAPDTSLRKVFAQTGLSFESCRIIYNYIQDNKDTLNSAIIGNLMGGSILSYIYIVFKCLSNLKEMQPSSTKLTKLALFENSSFISEIVKKWVHGDRIELIRDYWLSQGEEYTADNFNIFIENLLSYKFTWGTSAFNQIFAHISEIELKELPKDVIYSPSFVKYGLSNIFACWAKSVGVPTRESALILGNHFSDIENNKDLQGFLKWFSNLSIEDIQEVAGLAQSSYEIKRILEVSRRLNIEKYTVTDKQVIHHFFIKGISFDMKRIEVAQKLIPNSSIELERDYDNTFDVYAIKVMHQKQQVGYVPRELAKQLALDIDLDGEKYSGVVASKSQRGKLFAVEVRVSKGTTITK